MARLTAEFWDTRVILQRIHGNDADLGVNARTGIMNLYEAVHNTLLRQGKREARGLLAILGNTIEELSHERILAASEFRVREKHRGLSYADAAGYVTARELNAVFVTTDKAFKGLPGVKIVLRVEPS